MQMPVAASCRRCHMNSWSAVQRCHRGVLASTSSTVWALCDQAWQYYIICSWLTRTAIRCHSMYQIQLHAEATDVHRHSHLCNLHPCDLVPRA